MGWTLFIRTWQNKYEGRHASIIQTLFTIIKLLVCSGVLHFVWALKLLNVRHFECYLASCYRFSCYYRFSDIAINSVNPSFIWRLEFSKNDQLNISLYIRLFLILKPFLYFNILSIIWQLLLSVKWRHLFSCEVKTRPIYWMETNIKSRNGWF